MKPKANNRRTDEYELHCVVYVSRAMEHFDEASLNELTEHSAAKNERNGITGYLYYQDELFTQYFEGEPQATEELFSTLEEDSRHRILIAEREESLVRRRFNSWHMRRLDRRTLKKLYPEQILTEELVFLQRLSPSSYECSETLWKMVDTLASLRESNLR